MNGGEARGHREALQALGIADESVVLLTQYLNKLAEWSPRVNLSGARSAVERVAILVAPVVPVARDLAAGTALDVGSGNGSPGLVLALLRPDIDMTLLEPRMKRWAFLREAVRITGASRVKVVRERLENFGGTPVQTVTIRALRVALREIRRCVVEEGDVIVFGSAPASDAGFERIPAPETWPTGVCRFRLRP